MVSVWSMLQGTKTRLLGPKNGEGVRVVTGQRPTAGQRARVGSEVRATFRWVHFGSAAPARRGESERVRVPKVEGLSLREAVRRLRRGGLAADAIGPTAGRSGTAIVTAQSPRHGVSAARGATVRITWRFTR